MQTIKLRPIRQKPDGKRDVILFNSNGAAQTMEWMYTKSKAWPYYGAASGAVVMNPYIGWAYSDEIKFEVGEL